MKVKDAMHKGLHFAEPSTPVLDLAKKMRELDVGALPIGKKNQLVGIVTDRDIVVRALADGMDVSCKTAKDIMSKVMIYCRENEDIEDAIRLMEQKKVRRLPVLDNNEHAVGMLSLGDVSHVASHTLSGEVLSFVSDHHP